MIATSEAASKLQREDTTKTAFFVLGRSGISYNFISHQMTFFIFRKEIRVLQSESEKQTEIKTKKADGSFVCCILKTFCEVKTKFKPTSGL